MVATAHIAAGLQLILLAPVFDDDLVHARRTVTQADRGAVLHPGNAQRQALQTWQLRAQSHSQGKAVVDTLFMLDLQRRVTGETLPLVGAEDGLAIRVAPGQSGAEQKFAGRVADHLLAAGVALDASPLEIHRQARVDRQVVGRAQRHFIQAAQLAVGDGEAGVVAEGEQGFRQLQVGRVVVGLVGLRLEGGGLRQTQRIDSTGGIDAIIAWQTLVEGFKQLAGSRLVLLGQRDRDFCPQRPIGATTAAPGVLVPEETPLGGVFGAILQPADGGFCGRIRVTGLARIVEAQQFAQRVETDIAGALGQQQAGAGNAPCLIEAFFGQPALAGGMQRARAAFCLPLLGQQVAAQAPGTVGLLVLIQRIGIVHQPDEIVLVRGHTWIQITLQGDLRQ